MPNNIFTGWVAESYDGDSEMNDPALLDRTVSFLADAARGGAALEFGIGTGRVGLPLSQTVRETVRLLPDTMRLVKRLATDRTIPLRTRLPVWLLVVYLASPLDLIPDFVPVIGYADDAIVTSLVLRHLIRHAGRDKLAEHWPGSTEGLARLQQLLRLSPPT